MLRIRIADQINKVKCGHVIFILLLLLLAPALSSSASVPVRFGPLPMHTEVHVRREFFPFLQHLETVFQRPVEFVYLHSYKGILDGLKNDKIDLAYLGPLPYTVVSRQDAGIVPLVQFLNVDGSLGYTCSVGVFSGSQLSMESLKGKSFALTQPYSTCGFLATESILNLHDLSLNDSRYGYVGQHPTSALAVIEGKFDACGIKTSIGKQFEDLGLALIGESMRLPGFVLVANSRTLSQADIDRVRENLLALKPLENKQDAELTRNWGQIIKYGTAPVANDDFRGINALLKQIDVPGLNQ